MCNVLSCNLLKHKFGIRFLPKKRSKKPNPNLSVFNFLENDRFLIFEKPKFFKTEKPNQNSKKNRMPSPNGYVPQILLGYQSIVWWLDTRANVHVCSDLIFLFLSGYR
jgi:hypothetical protein